MLTRVGGLLLIIASLVAVLLVVLATGGSAVGLGGAEVNGQYVVAYFALIAAGTAAIAVGGVAPFGSLGLRLASANTSAGSLFLAVSGVGGESTAILALIGLVIMAVGLFAVGAILIRRPGWSARTGAAMLVGLLFTVAGTIGPREFQPVAFLGLALVLASIAAFGILAFRVGGSRSTPIST
jgi:hypothetical protein